MGHGLLLEATSISGGVTSLPAKRVMAKGYALPLTATGGAKYGKHPLQVLLLLAAVYLLVLLILVV